MATLVDFLNDESVNNLNKIIVEETKKRKKFEFEKAKNMLSKILMML